MKSTKRAERRHHKQRLFKKYRKMLSSPHNYWGDAFEVSDTKVKKIQDNFSVCSCSMCRNERRNPDTSGQEKLTMQERKAFQKELLEY